MATRTGVSREEYLQTSYEYDREYVDGEILERGVPTYQHSRALRELIGAVRRVQDELRLFAAPDLRLAVSPTRVRIPDLAIFADREPTERVPATPPLAVIEVLSPDDSLADLLTKFDEYRAWGVAFIWLVDPERRRVHHDDGANLIQVDAIELADRGFRLPATEVFTAPCRIR